MARITNAHQEAAAGVQLRYFGYTTYATPAALPGTGNPGEIVYVTSNGRLYMRDDANSEWIIWGDSRTSSWKQAVRAHEAAANVTLATPGATIDGVTMVAGDRFLVSGQTDPIENGIYIWNGAAAAATRADDLDTGTEAEGASVFVTEGTVNADTQYQQTADGVTIGTDAQTWALVGPATGVAAASDTVAGVVELSTDAEAIAGTDTARAVTPANLTAVFDDRGGTALFGGATTGTIAHGVTGLAATDDLIIQVTDEATGFKVDIDTSNDATDITWAAVVAPAANAYRATWFSVA